MTDEEARELTLEPEPEAKPGGWLEVRCVNARLGNERFCKNSFVKLTPERAKLLARVPEGTFRLHKKLDKDHRERLEANGLLVE